MLAQVLGPGGAPINANAQQNNINPYSMGSQTMITPTSQQHSSFRSVNTSYKSADVNAQQGGMEMGHQPQTYTDPSTGQTMMYPGSKGGY